LALGVTERLFVVVVSQLLEDEKARTKNFEANQIIESNPIQFACKRGTTSLLLLFVVVCVENVFSSILVLIKK
jgi:hypothetical protein